MIERYILYIDILGFKEISSDPARAEIVFNAIDDLNVHQDNDFQTIVFSDTIVVAADEFWNGNANQAIMWLSEFAQDLFYRLSHRDIHFRGIITYGNFEFKKRKNFDAYYGDALVRAYLDDSKLKACGLFIDKNISKNSTIFQTSSFEPKYDFVHIMQHLDDLGNFGGEFPISGDYLLSTGMEYWVAYLFRYLEIINNHRKNYTLPSDVRAKYEMTWQAIAFRHDNLLRRLDDSDFKLRDVIDLDWTDAQSRIGTDEGAWG